MAPSTRTQRFVNKWGARVIPLLLIGLVGYATWVLPVLIGVKYLLNPSRNAAPRTGVGIAIVVLYFVLMVPMAISYACTLYIVATDPGYVSMQAEASNGRQRSSRRRKRTRRGELEKDSSSEKDGVTPSQMVGYLDRGAVYSGRLAPPPGLEQFYNRDIFECEVDGLPRYCSTCESWKADRSHHSSEVDKCVYKLDHFCPWVGGIVSESSFKAFVLFCLYGGLYCVFVLIVTAYFSSEQHRLAGVYDINWIIVAALSGLFGLFTLGMGLNSLHAISINSTTVDNLSRRSRIHHFCVLLPTNSDGTVTSHPTGRYPIPTITYPLPDPVTGLHPSGVTSPPRTFGIVVTPTGRNPYLLSSRLDNIKTVMGNRVWEWVLPFVKSPCYSHVYEEPGLGTLMYPLGPVIDRVIAEAGLPRRREDIRSGSDKEARLQRKRASSQTKRGQRPAAAEREADAQTAQVEQEPQGSVTLARLEEGRM